jgi:alpha-N-arabinofuranosidase
VYLRHEYLKKENLKKGDKKMRNLVINAAKKGGRINKNIYGNFSEHLGRCVYNGLYVGEDSDIPNVNGMRTDVVDALKRIKLPVLRWPGGCFADAYHWKDGIGAKETRKRMVNTHWGGVVEDNSFGTHEFMEFCRQVGCEPYINGNLGSGTVAEMSEWVEYMTFGGLSPMAELREKNGQKEPWNVKYFGVGNENWGCGGHMRPEYYADEYRRYQTYVRDFGDNKVYKIACGPSGADYDWTEVLMKNAARYMDGLSLHYYTVTNDWANKGAATGFSETDYCKTLKKAFFMDELIGNHTRVMDLYDPEKRIGLIVDEWGTWHDVEQGTNPGFLYQQNTMRDAIVAGLTLNIFNRHSDRVAMANIAQLANVLQAVILTEGEKMLLTPTYHVFDLYKHHMDAALVDSYVEAADIGGLPDLHVSASEDEGGTVHITLVNAHAADAQKINLQATGAENVSGRILCGETTAYNDFGNPQNVKIAAFDGFNKTETGVVFDMPACAVMEIVLK